MWKTRNARQCEHLYVVPNVPGGFSSPSSPLAHPHSTQPRHAASLLERSPRAIRFSREHAGDRSESAEKQTFWNDFFSVFGLRRASLASFEANVTNLKGNKGAIDLLWRGKLLVEHKSRGEDLGLAQTQAFTYIEDLTRAQHWEWPDGKAQLFSNPGCLPNPLLPSDSR